MNFEDLRENVDKFEKYLKESHPEITKNINKIWLSKLLKVCDLDIIEATKLLKLNIEKRIKVTEIFKNRNFFSEESILSRKAL